MSVVFGTLDIVVLIASTLLIMGVGLWVGRRETGTEDFFLAGRKVRWWAVAGSIFGTNVSANHLVGMMGIGYSIGFAQSHFELGAIAGLMLLCYGFLPLYKRMGVFTLSEYLGNRYNEASRVLYSLIAMIICYVGYVILTERRLGRTLKAVRDTEIATGPLGISATHYKLVAFGLSAFAAALAGAAWAQNFAFVNPQTFRTSSARAGPTSPHRGQRTDRRPPGPRSVRHLSLLRRGDPRWCRSSPPSTERTSP